MVHHLPFYTQAARRRLLPLLTAALLLSGCTATPSSTGAPDPSLTGPAAQGAAGTQTYSTGTADTQRPSTDATTITLPPVNSHPDYQLAGAYTPDPAVDVVGRDRNDPPADGVYSICYINGFQTQPDERQTWPEDLLLHIDGVPFADPEWPDEVLLDTSSSANREQIAAIIQPWIKQCANDGFDAVEFDNLDSYTRSGGALSLDDNLAQAQLLVEIAHREGLAAGQKNSAEASQQLHDSAGFDFAVVEECMAYNECQDYAAVYRDHVIDIEYVDEEAIDGGSTGYTAFQEYCAHADAPTSMVLRNRDLSTPGSRGYVFRLCD